VQVVIVSTHLDDAVFSCWHVLAGPTADVRVVTVFAGRPDPGVTTSWDADTGVDSATRMAQRVEENQAALAVAGRAGVDLGLLEGQYGGGAVDPEDLRPHLAAADVVYVPAGISLGHVNAEHVVVRDASLAVRPDATLYADQPYCLFRSDVDLPEGLAAGRERRAIQLGPVERQRKAEAIRCYAGELRKLEREFGPCAEPARLLGEAVWTLL
jgi:hypothetical protein